MKRNGRIKKPFKKYYKFTKKKKTDTITPILNKKDEKKSINDE